MHFNTVRQNLVQIKLNPDITLSLRFNGHFPGGPGLAGTRMSPILDYIRAKGDGGGDNDWSYKTCKAPVKLLPPTNQLPVF